MTRLFGDARIDALEPSHTVDAAACFGSRGIPGSLALDSSADGSRGLSEERVCADRLYDLT
jgi:hypothetical protein